MKTKSNEIKSRLASLQIKGVQANVNALYWYNEAKESYLNMLFWLELDNEEMFTIAYNNANTSLELSEFRLEAR